MDQNGNHTYYDYDDDNRVIGTWTDVQGGQNSSTAWSPTLTTRSATGRA